MGEGPVPGRPHRILLCYMAADLTLFTLFRLQKKGRHACRYYPTEVLNKYSLNDL